MKKRVLALLLIIILLFCANGCSKSKLEISDKCLTAYFFDVGQADCSLLLLPDGSVVLIDAGDKADGNLIVDFLDNLGIQNIDYFICTHPHSDHIGGAEYIFDAFKINTVCIPSIDEAFIGSSALYTNLNKMIVEEGCKKLELTAETLILDTSNCQIKTISPVADCVYSDLNDFSLNLLVNGFTNTILFTGDSGIASENDMLKLGMNLDADILKVGHHGSKESSGMEFLRAVTPQAAIISSGEGNTYGHPHEDTINRLKEINANIYRTDTVGSIIAKCYDGGFNIETKHNLCLDGN